MLTITHRWDDDVLVRGSRDTDEMLYAVGWITPNYPVPAVTLTVGWQPTGANEYEGIPYWYVSNEELLTTYWAHGETIFEAMLPNGGYMMHVWK